MLDDCSNLPNLYRCHYLVCQIKEITGLFVIMTPPLGGGIKWWCCIAVWRLSVAYIALCGLRVVRIDPLHFLAGCRKKQLNQGLSVLSFSLGFLWLCVVLLTRDSFFRLCYFYVVCVFCHLVVLVRLSVPMQVIDWKDLSPKWSIMCWWGR